MNSTKSRISLGDKVKLKSGGPIMIVVDLEWGECVCAYLVDNEVREFSIKGDCLTKEV